MLPKGWKLQPLSRIATIERGKFSARPRNDPRYFGGATPFIQTGDVASSDGRITTYSQTLNPKGLAVSKTFPKGTIFITIAANIGKVAIAEFDTACPDSVVAIRPINGTAAAWLLYALLVEQRKLEAFAGQNAQKNINLETLRPLLIRTPPQGEQRRIADILDIWTAHIEQATRLIEAKQKLRKGLTQKLLSGKCRFPKFGKAAKQKGMVPEGWRRSPLGEEFERITRTGNGTRRLEHLSITATVGFVTQKEKFSKVIAGEQSEKYIHLARGEFAYNKGNSKPYPYGCVYRLTEFADALVPHVYFCFRPKSADVDAEFFSHYFEQGMLNYQLSRLINSGTRNNGLLNLRPREFFQTEILIPPIQEQQAIARCISSVATEIRSLEHLRDRLKTQKLGLIKKLLTGKIRLKVQP